MKKTMHQRLDKITGSLSAKAAILLAMDQARSLADCKAWYRDHPGEALLGDLRQILEPLCKTPSRPPLREVSKKVRQRLVDRGFLARLWSDCNDYVADVTERKLPWLALIAEKNSRAMEQLEGRRGAFEALQMLGAEPYPLNLDDAAALEAAINHEVYPWEPLLSCDVPDWVQEDPATAAGQAAAGALGQAIRGLIKAGEVKDATAVELGPITMESLLLAPLVEGHWIDAHVMELAEFGAAVEEAGFEQWVGEDHFLAPLQICQSVQGGQLIEGDEKVIASIRQQTVVALAKFTGRTTELDGRCYLHIDDYRAWPGRRVQGDLHRVDGIVVSSWNQWVDRHGGEGQAELAGSKVRKLRVLAKRTDFMVCADANLMHLLRQQRALRLAQIGRVWGVCKAPEDYGGDLLELLKYLLETQFAIEIVGEHYFDGHPVLFKEYDNKLSEQIEVAEGLADSYNQLPDLAAPLGGVSPHGGHQALPSRIDIGQVKLAAKGSSKTAADALVAKVKSAIRTKLDCSKRAHEIITSNCVGDVG